MVFAKNLAALAALVSFASAAPLQVENKLSKRAFSASGSNNVAVWIGNSAATTKDGLQKACADDSIDIVILTFATSISGNKINVAHGGPADSEMGPIIKTCQKAGKKVFMSFGGATGTMEWPSADDAKKGAKLAHEQFLTDDKSMYGVALDGIDLDIETGKSAHWVDFTRELVSLKSENQYVAGAPQCISPDASLPFDVLNQMDFVWVQFYNNPSCMHGGGFLASAKDWSAKLTKPKLYIGTAGSPASAPAGGYIGPAELESEIKQVKSSIPNLGGYTFWDYDTAAQNNNLHKTVKSALGGSTGGSGAPPAGSSSKTPAAGPTTTPAAGSSSKSPAAGPTTTPAAGAGTTPAGATPPAATPSKHEQSGAAGASTVKATSTVHVTSTKKLPTGTGSPSQPIGTGSPSSPGTPSTGGADTQTCSSAGTIVCSADGKSFGICDGASATLMRVSDGTTCQGGNIVASDGGAAAPAIPAATPASGATPAASSGAAATPAAATPASGAIPAASSGAATPAGSGENGDSDAETPDADDNEDSE